MNRTLILSCSATKLTDGGRLRAIDRYCGPAFRTFRANKPRDLAPPLILSAEFGLISGLERIPFYNRRMDRARADELRHAVANRLLELEHAGELGAEIFFVGGKTYRECIIAALNGRSLLERVRFASGGIGDQLGQLKAFLRREAA